MEPQQNARVTTNNEPLPGPAGAPASPPTSNLAVLERLARAAQVPFDEVRARRALRQAELDIPPTATRASRQRLSQAALALGMQLLSRQLSIREALAVVDPAAPLALFAVGPEGTARWYILLDQSGGRGRLARLQSDDPEGYLEPEEIARLIDAANAETVVEWLIAQPSAPLAKALDSSEPTAPTHSEAPHGPPPLRRLLGLVHPDRQDLWIVLVYAIAIGLLSLATPIALMAVVNTVALATLVQQLIALCLGLLLCLGLVALLRILQTIVVEFIQRRIFGRVAADLAHRLPRVQLAAFDRQHGPELVNRFFDVLTAQKASATLLLDGVDVLLQTVIGLALLASYHQVLLGFDLVLLAALAFLVWPLGRGAVTTAIRESRAKYAVASWLQEMARHPAAFKLGGGPGFALEQTDLLTREYLLAREQHFRIMLRQYSFALAVYALATTSLLILGGYLVIDGQLTLGQLVAAEFVLGMVVASFTKLGKQLESYYDLLAAVEKLGHLIDLPLERSTGVAHQAQSKGAAIRLHDVCFSYDDGHRIVLDHFSLTIEPGERIALLGPNGAGKSTLVDLLFGMRMPTRGYIEIDGQDLRDIRLESLRQHVAIVKGVEVVEGSVLHNVCMGREDISITEARLALQAVGLLDEILDLPGGLQTLLWAGGSPLSLGQAERLMLARAVAGQPRLLVLDELLDDMDERARRELIPALFGPEARWTLLVVTHSKEVAELCGRQVQLERRRPLVPAVAVPEGPRPLPTHSLQARH